MDSFCANGNEPSVLSTRGSYRQA